MKQTIRTEVPRHAGVKALAKRMGVSFAHVANLIFSSVLEGGPAEERVLRAMAREKQADFAHRQTARELTRVYQQLEAATKERNEYAYAWRTMKRLVIENVPTEQLQKIRFSRFQDPHPPDVDEDQDGKVDPAKVAEIVERLTREATPVKLGRA